MTGIIGFLLGLSGKPPKRLAWVTGMRAHEKNTQTRGNMLCTHMQLQVRAGQGVEQKIVGGEVISVHRSN